MHRRTLFLADYEPIDLIAWCNALRQTMDAPPIRTLPRPVAQMLARCGDLINATGVRGFPFNSFRLRNILTEYKFDLEETRAICGPVPVTMHQGVTETVAWFTSLNERGADT